MERSPASRPIPPRQEDTVSQHPSHLSRLLPHKSVIHSSTYLFTLFTPSPHLCLCPCPVMSQQLLILEMFIITLVTRLLYRREYDPLPKEDPDDMENAKMVAVPVEA